MIKDAYHHGHRTNHEPGVPPEILISAFTTFSTLCLFLEQRPKFNKTSYPTFCAAVYEMRNRTCQMMGKVVQGEIGVFDIQAPDLQVVNRHEFQMLDIDVELECLPNTLAEWICEQETQPGLRFESITEGAIFALSTFAPKTSWDLPRIIQRCLEALISKIYEIKCRPCQRHGPCCQ